jgi:hypothetical protein
MNTKTITTQQAEAIGRRAAEIATAEADGGDPVRPIYALSGCVLQSLRGNQRSRAGLIEAIESYAGELLAERTEVLGSERGDDVIKACDEWLEDLRASMAQQPGAVRRGVEAWVDDYLSDHEIN